VQIAVSYTKPAAVCPFIKLTGTLND